MRNLILPLLLLGVTILPARAETSYSRLLHSVQQKYLSGDAAPYPILIMDRDDLEWRFVLGNSVNDAKKREGIIQKYILEKTGIHITVNAASNFEVYLTVLKNSAVAMPALPDDSSGKPAMCAVFPPDPNGNQRLETERLLQLNVQEAYGNLTFDQFKDTMAYGDLLLFSLLHESAHCMDQTFFPQAYSGQDDPHTLHQGESFAETVAVLLMAKENRVAIAKPRSALRSAYTYFMEPFFAHHPENGIGSTNYPYAGLIYFLTPSILAAGQEVDHSPDRIRSLSTSEVLDLAKDLVNKNALNSRLFTAIYASYAEGPEVALARYQEYAKTMPDLFADTFAGLNVFLKEMDQKKSELFDPDKSAPDVTHRNLRVIDYELLCDKLKRKNIEALLTEIGFLREDIETASAPLEDQRARAIQLAELWKDLPAKCGLSGESNPP